MKDRFTDPLDFKDFFGVQFNPQDATPYDIQHMFIGSPVFGEEIL